MDLDLKKMPQDQLTRFLFSAALSEGVYDQYQNPVAQYQAEANKSLPSKIGDLFTSAKNFLGTTDSSVYVGSYIKREPSADPFDLSKPDIQKRVLAVALKGSDDLSDFINDIHKSGPATVMEGYKNSSIHRSLAQETIQAILKNGAESDEIVLTGHSLGGYAASELLLELKRQASPEWWKQNASKITMDAIDPIGFSKEFLEQSKSGALAPAKLGVLSVRGSIARISMAGNSLEDPFSLEGPDVFKGLLAPKTTEWSEKLNPLSKIGRPLTVHGSTFIRGSLFGELIDRANAAHHNVRRDLPDLTSLGGRLTTWKMHKGAGTSGPVEFEDKKIGPNA